MTIVHLSCGDVRGTLEDQQHVFRGIPYAQALSGAARWLPPQPRARWSGTFDARHFGPCGMQFRKPMPPFLSRVHREFLNAIGERPTQTESDDSLLLNIWTPSIDRNARLPVMVYIHGGGFTIGSANEVYTGERYAAKGIVLVAIQYRLGPPGFLHGSGLFDGDFCADNRAFLDQLLALQWVQEHIERFGGDPGCVTVFGESAGAFSVYPLSVSPMAKGLLHRAIAMGGSITTCAPAQDYHALTRELLPKVGVAVGDRQALTALEKPQLMRLQDLITRSIYFNRDPQRYGALGRTRVGAMGTAVGTPFQPRPLLDTYRDGTPNDIDLMIGTCADDGQLFSMMLPPFRMLSARVFMSVLSGLFPQHKTAPARAFYRRQMVGADRLRRYDQINNDAFYRMPTIRAAEAHAIGHPGRTWLYEIGLQCAIPGLRAIHGIDVALLFGLDSPARRALYDDEQTRAVSEQMLDAWTRFARSGSPQSPDLPWPAYDEVDRATMVFDATTRVERDWAGQFRPFWATA
ncbi:carboxylesterase/lipase family protein [Solimonas marina]|uniref:Carboxylic ester hydrolase n=1 Tax=Solimonas marina TaxID=2714601 RepID=A0A970B550_9GAMM|nr:carboxylesterase family protein [Solimonas marina]NKF23032.1 carboxylesterase/lipase family protein [Solimonas marina]